MSQSVNDTELYSSVPSAERARHLRLRMYQILIRDLGSFANASRGVLPGIADDTLAGIGTLDPERRLNPVLFTLHWKLSTGIHVKDVTRVGSALGELARVIEEGRQYCDQFQIENLQWDTLDTEIYEFLVSPEGPRTPKGGYPILRRLADTPYREARDWVEECLPILREVDPGLYGEFDHFVSALRLFHGDAARGITSSRCWGKILLRVPDEAERSEPLMYFLDHITHETSHIVLHSIMSTNPLIKNGFTGRFSAPIRWDPRPLYGIYHATYVLSRISRVLHGYAEREQRGDVLAGRDLAVSRFYKGYETIDQHGELTDAGRQVLDSCRETVDGLR